MRLAQRRLVGIGGAAGVAVGLTLALAGVASAHTPAVKAGCADDGHATITITAKQYATNGADKTPNTITVTVDGDKTPVFTTKFGVNFDNSDPSDPKGLLKIDGTKAHDVVVHFAAFDDPDGSKHFTKDLEVNTTVCEQPSSPPPSPSSTTTPPTTTTTSKEVVPPPATTTTTKAVAVASKELPNTGVSAGLPLGIGAALVLAGGGLLFGMRYSARRRHSS